MGGITRYPSAEAMYRVVASEPAGSEGLLIYDASTGLLKLHDGAEYQEVLQKPEWQSYTPSVQAWATGNGSVVSKYVQIGTTIHYKGIITLGTTSIMTGDALMPSLPVNAIAGDWIGVARMVDASASFNRYVGLAEIVTAVFGQYVHFASTGNNLWNNSNPTSFASGDSISWDITYEAA